MSVLTRFADAAYTLRFLRLLTTDWKDMNAYKLGLIDENGKRIRKPKTNQEKSVYNFFHRLVFSLKRLLNKLPFGKTKLASYAAALWLIKEETGLEEEAIEKILNRIDIDIDHSINESVEDSKISVGFYKNDTPILDKTSGELIEDSVQIFVKKSEPVGKFFGVCIYEGINTKTNGKVMFTREEVSMKEEIANVTGDSPTMAMPAFPMAKSPEDENPHLFRRYKIFDMPREAFNKFQTGKVKFERWSKYLNLEDKNQKQVYDYAKKKPKSMIVLRDSTTGALLAIRKRTRNSD